jgi:nucleotide-binding universal stress UspA family protein
MDRLIQENKLQQLHVLKEIREGSPFYEIIRYAKERDIDLIVMGTHGRSGLVHVLLGSVTEKVVRKAPCPVLTVRHPEHEFVHP